MEWTIYFNKNFKSGASARPFTRVCFVDEEKGNMFGSMCGVNDEKAQRLMVYGCEKARHIDGFCGTSFKEDEIVALVSTLSEEEKAAFKKVFMDLTRSFRAYIVDCSKKGINYDYAAQRDVFSKIQKIREDFEKMCGGVVEVFEAKKDVEFVELKECSGELLDKIIVAVFEKEGEVVEVDGKHYCLKVNEKNNRKEIFEVLNFSSSVESEPEKEEDVSKKKTEKMAYVINDEFLFNFNKGELYTIVSMDGEFVKLIDVFGEARNIKKNRVEFVEVEQELVYE